MTYKFLWAILLVVGTPLLDENGKVVLDPETKEPVLVAEAQYVTPVAASFHAHTINLQNAIGKRVLFGIVINKKDYPAWQQADKDKKIVLLGDNWTDLSNNFATVAKPKTDFLPYRENGKVRWRQKMAVDDDEELHFIWATAEVSKTFDHYNVYVSRDGGEFALEGTSSSENFMVQGIDRGTVRVKVAAVNMAGEGPCSEVSDPVLCDLTGLGSTVLEEVAKPTRFGGILGRSEW